MVRRRCFRRERSRGSSSDIKQAESLRTCCWAPRSAVMLAFGLGTLPNIAASGFAFSRAKPIFERNAWRYAAGALIAAFALVGTYRALYVPEALAQGPFCLVP